MLKVFADMHQDDLYFSLWLLFVKRLGGELYRPTGLDWVKRGYWKYSDNPDVVRQYLETPKNAVNKGDYWEIYESKHDYYHKALTFRQFIDKDIDLIIGSVNQHEEPYLELVKKVKPRAKFIRQVGNTHDNVNWDIVKNAMISANPIPPPPDVNVVYYHQEFELTTFKYLPPINYNKITNLMNCVPDSPDFPAYKEYKSLLPDFNWKMYGILGDDGIIGTEIGVAKAIQNATFIWHLKHQGDGFGHIIHNAFACGRPPIVKASYYNEELASALMEDTITCIDLDERTVEDNLEMIRACAKPEVYRRMSENAYRRFRECVDYDYEFKKITEFLGRLK